jgi:nucleoside-diphosphate-sugar epimerase
MKRPFRCGSDVKKAIIAGLNGYVGSVVVRHRLEAVYDVHATANKNHRLLNRLLSEGSMHIHNTLHGRPAEAVRLVTSLSPDATFHLAARYDARIS